MKTLIPTLLAILIIGTAQAQKDSYASFSTKKISPDYSAVNSEKNEPYIKIQGRTDRKIVLSWAPFAGGVSHYVLERSMDGRTFEEAGIFFTGDWDNEQEYFYTEKFHKPYSGPLFYRLRVVGVEGSVIYTPVTIMNATVAVN
jgi:hypothetical protein